MDKRTADFRPRIVRPVGLEGTEVHTGKAAPEIRSRRIHPDYLLFVVDGGRSVTVQCDQRTARVPDGSLVMVEPERSLEITSDHEYTYRGIFISPDAMRQIFAPDSSDPRCTIALPQLFTDHPVVTRTFLAVHAALETAVAPVDAQILLLRLFLVLSGLHLVRRVSGTPVRRAVIERVRELILESHPDRMTLDQLSRRIGMSKYALVHAFTREFGIPPHTYQTYLRVKRARNLIRQGCALSDVALSVGFTDQSHLNRHFKRFLGYTPGVYARQVGGG